MQEVAASGLLTTAAGMLELADRSTDESDRRLYERVAIKYLWQCLGKLAGLMMQPSPACSGLE